MKCRARISVFTIAAVLAVLASAVITSAVFAQVVPTKLCARTS